MVHPPFLLTWLLMGHLPTFQTRLWFIQVDLDPFIIRNTVIIEYTCTVPTGRGTKMCKRKFCRFNYIRRLTLFSLLTNSPTPSLVEDYIILFIIQFCPLRSEYTIIQIIICQPIFFSGAYRLHDPWVPTSLLTQDIWFPTCEFDDNAFNAIVFNNCWITFSRILFTDTKLLAEFRSVNIQRVV